MPPVAETRSKFAPAHAEEQSSVRTRTMRAAFEGKNILLHTSPAFLSAGEIECVEPSLPFALIIPIHKPAHNDDGGERSPSNYWTVRVKVTVALCAPVKVPAPLVGATATPMKRVCA